MLSPLRSHALAAFLFVLIAATAAAPEAAQAQQMEDVIYFTDGRVIRGTIVEQIPGQSLLIRTHDGNVLRFQLAEIQRIAKEAAVGPVRQAAPAELKSPGTALALSFLLNGLGQGYNGETGKGLLHFGIGLLSAGIFLAGIDPCYSADDYDCTLYGIGLGGVILTKAWTMYDAYTSANRINREAGLALQFDPRIRVARELVSTGYGVGEPGRRASYKVHLNLATLRF